MALGDLLPEIAVLIAAVVALLAASFLPQRRQAWCAAIALAGLVAAALFCASQLSRPDALTFSGTWALDGASTWARLIILAATGVVVLLCPEWLRTDRRHGEHYTVLLLSALGAMMLAGAADTLQLVVGVLLSSVTGYTLAAYHRASVLSVEAGMKYFLVGAMANALLLIGIALLFGIFATTGYAAMAMAARTAAASPALLLGLTLVVVGVAFKMGAVPAHAWMPDVAQGAPVPAAAFLTVVPKIGAAVALARLLHVFPDANVEWHTLVAIIAAVTMTLGNLAALGQGDLRRLLGWSSVAQAGYALMAVAVVGLSRHALPALLLFLASYAAANLAAFAAVAWLRGRTRLDDYRGLASRRPAAAAVLTASLLSLAGIPPLAGFAGKLGVFLATLDAGLVWLAVVAVANTVASLYYYLGVIRRMYLDEAGGPVAVLGPTSRGAMLAGAAAVFGIGLGAGIAWEAIRGASLLP